MILFILWEHICRLTRRSAYRKHMAYQKALDDWLDGTGPQPNIKEFYR